MNIFNYVKPADITIVFKLDIVIMFYKEDNMMFQILLDVDLAKIWNGNFSHSDIN